MAGEVGDWQREGVGVKGDMLREEDPELLLNNGGLLRLKLSLDGLTGREMHLSEKS